MGTLMAVFLVYVAAIFGLFAVLAFVEEWLTGLNGSTGRGGASLTPQAGDGGPLGQRATIGASPTRPVKAAHLSANDEWCWIACPHDPPCEEAVKS